MLLLRPLRRRKSGLGFVLLGAVVRGQTQGLVIVHQLLVVGTRTEREVVCGRLAPRVVRKLAVEFLLLVKQFLLMIQRERLVQGN